MRKFYNYFDYAAWRDEGDNCDTPVKLIGADPNTWCERYETKKELAELRAELQAEREHASRLAGDLHEMWVHEAQDDAPFPESLRLYKERSGT